MEEQPRVVLLRSAYPPDPYLEAFAEAGFAAACEPVLGFAFPHQETLAERLARPDGYAGLILTSPRAVRALESALARQPPQRAAWTARPAYAVGPRTSEALRKIGFAPEGAEAGRAAALADVIARRAAGAKPLLFLCGNRRRETLPQQLQGAGVPFEEQEVYETHVRSDLDFSAPPLPDWLVFFSPSGLEAVQQARGFDPSAVRLAAIGPTTAAALKTAGYAVSAVAADPTPEALVRAVEGAVRRSA